MKIYSLAITLFSILAILPFNCFAQTSQSLSPMMKADIDNFNQFLKTFDNGYYGYVELTNGTLYVRRKDSEVIYFALSDISDVQTIREKSGQLKVTFNCRDDKECVFSGKEKYRHMTFWEKGSFADITTLKLAKSIFDRYNADSGSPTSKTDSSENNSTVAIETPKISLQSNTTVGNSPSPSSMMIANIDNFNQYLKTFDDGYYGYIELINGILYVRHQNGKTSHFKLGDISDVQVIIDSSAKEKVAFLCKYEKECVTIGKDKIMRMAFWKKGSFDVRELRNLAKNVLESYKNEMATAGSFADCKIILSDGCRNFFLRSTVEQVSPYLKDFKDSQIRLEVEPSSGGIIGVIFYPESGFKPAEDLKWKDKPENVLKKYGDPIRTTKTKPEFDVYKEFQINYYAQKEVYSIKLTRERTASELAAFKAREAIANSPEVLSKTLNSDYEKMLKTFESKVNEVSILVAEFDQIKASGNISIDNYRSAKQRDILDKIHQIKKGLIVLIDDYLNKYKSIIPERRKQHLLKQREKFLE